MTFSTKESLSFSTFKDLHIAFLDLFQKSLMLYPINVIHYNLQPMNSWKN